MKQIGMIQKGSWTMRLILVAIGLQFSIFNLQAQPKQRRNQQQQQQQQQKQQLQQGGAQGVTQRMQLQYPVALDMPEDVVWRRDIYREIDLTQEDNAGLYYPVEPQGRQMNLFTYVFKLALNGNIPVYEYNLDGNEVLEASAKVEMKSILDNYHIFYEEQQGKLKVDNSDIPSQEVKMYYLKESAYYDQANSSFHIKPLAFCPVMVRDDDFGGEAAKYPLFWVKYSDVEPYLSRQTIKTSDINDAAVMNLDDYFTLNKYRGKIYKTANRLGKTIAQVAGGDSTRYSEEQKRIEAELEAFRKGIFGSVTTSDTTTIATNDSLAPATKAKKVKATTRQREKKEKEEKQPRASRRRASSGSSSGSGSGLSVRRQRH